jgi:hypothetical protein
MSVVFQTAAVQQLVSWKNSARYMSTDFRALVEALKLKKVEINSEN